MVASVELLFVINFKVQFITPIIGIDHGTQLLVMIKQFNYNRWSYNTIPYISIFGVDYKFRFLALIKQFQTLTSWSSIHSLVLITQFLCRFHNSINGVNHVMQFLALMSQFNQWCDHALQWRNSISCIDHAFWSLSMITQLNDKS